MSAGASKVLKAIKMVTKPAGKTAKEYLKKDKTGATRAGKIAKSVVGATQKGRRTGQAVRNKQGQVSGLKPKDIKTANAIRTGAIGIGAAAAGLSGIDKENSAVSSKEAPSRREVPITEQPKKGREVLTSNERGAKKYTVKAGDTLSEIAKKNNTTVRKLKEANNIKNVDRIKVGQQIIIPDDGADRKNPYRTTTNREMKTGNYAQTRKKSESFKTGSRVGSKPRGCGAATRGYGKAMMRGGSVKGKY